MQVAGDAVPTVVARTHTPIAYSVVVAIFGARFLGTVRSVPSRMTVASTASRKSVGGALSMSVAIVQISAAVQFLIAALSRVLYITLACSVSGALPLIVAHHAVYHRASVSSGHVLRGDRGYSHGQHSFGTIANELHDAFRISRSRSCSRTNGET